MVIFSIPFKAGETKTEIVKLKNRESYNLIETTQRQSYDVVS